MKKKQYFIVTMVSAAALSLSACGAGNSQKTVTLEETTTSAETTESTAAPTSEQADETEVESTEPIKPSSARSGELSDDIYEFQLQIDGEVYQFPMKYTDFVASGWVFKDDDTQMLDSGYRAISQVFDKGKLMISADIINFDVNARALNECYVGGVMIEEWQQSKAEVDAVLPKGIAIGVSTVDDIRTAYGTPGFDYTSESGRVTLEYSKDSYEKVKLVVDSESKKLNQIQIQNYVSPDDFEAGEVSSEIPEIVGRYKAPESISADLADFTIDFGSAIYQLPAPVSVFEANGWKMIEDATDLEVAGRDFGWVSLMKDNQTLKVIANNYSDQATSIRNCFVTSVKSDDSSIKIPLSISKGITVGMSRAELEKALEGTDYEKDDSSSISTCYEVAPGKSPLDVYEVYVKKTDDKVYKIEVGYSPKYDEYTKK